MLNRYTVSLMLMCVLIAWDRYTSAAHHAKVASPSKVAAEAEPAPMPAWDVVIGHGYVRARTVAVSPVRKHVPSESGNFQ
ncbi:MAG: hypothetical protein SH850_28415 [Planctomycetaceae bacterium]|nr:hypothetical protein [Planctomycetaceae bacterium]